VHSKALQTAGISGLGGPTLSLAGARYAYSASLDVNLDPVNQQLAQVLQHLPPPLSGLAGAIPANPFPSQYTYNRSDAATTASVSAAWPLYVGGATDAVRGFVDAQEHEAKAEALRTEHELMTQLVQRYFGAQLSAKAARLRQQAYENVLRHDQAIEKMLSSGVVSRIERLHARATLEEATRNLQKAQDDAALSVVALNSMLRDSASMTLRSPLFVLTEPIQDLAYFTKAAMEHHPGLSKVAAKKSQAEQLHAGQEALRKPQVFAFAQHQIAASNPDWVAGIGVRWTLFETLNRDKLSQATQQQIIQAGHTDAQARSDIALLVEKNWLLLEQARRHFTSLQSGTDLAQEILRLRRAGLKEGTSTTLDLMDAEISWAKIQTERAQVAFDYGMALARLLESCGLSEEFPMYLARADVKVE
jgi:outer membrane protein TolC